MENIDKRIAQGYADFADDGGVLAETNKVRLPTSMVCCNLLRWVRSTGNCAFVLAEK